MQLFQRYFALTMAFFLTFSNVGLAVNMHYCGGKLDKIILSYPHIDFDENCEIDQKTTHSCCENKSDEEKSETGKCCEDETLEQSTDEKIIIKHLSVQYDTFIPVVFETLTLFNFDRQSEAESSFVAFYCESNAPPFYKLYHQFLFYA